MFEYKRPPGDHRIYNIEAVDVVLGKKIEDAGMLGPDQLNSTGRDTPSKTSSDLNIIHPF